MQHQKLTDITRGLQAAAAETNALVADQFIRILSEYFDRHEDGTLEARMVRVQLDDNYYSLVPLVSLVSPSGLALERMRVQLSIRLEEAREERVNLLKRLKNAADSNEDEDGDVTRSDFKVSLSPRDRKQGKRRPSDHVHIDLEFRSLETPESIMRVIETYTNMVAPIPIQKDINRPPTDEGPTPPDNGPDEGPGGGPDSEPDGGPVKNTQDGGSRGPKPQAGPEASKTAPPAKPASAPVSGGENGSADGGQQK